MSRMFIRLLAALGILILCSVSDISATESYGMDELGEISRKSTPKLFEEGNRAFLSSDFDNALKIFTVICKRYDGSGDKETQRIFAESFDRYGNILFKRGAYSLAMDAYLKARSIAETNSFNAQLARTFANIGNIYASSADYTSAQRFFTRSLSLIDSNKEPRLNEMVINNLVMTNILLDSLPQAERYYRIYERSVPHSDRYHFDMALDRGMIKEREGKTDSAISYYRHAADMSVRRKMPPLCIGSAYSCLATAFMKTGESDSALIYYHKAEHLARSAGNGRLVVEVLRDIANFYEHKNIPDSALEYRRQYLSLADSINYQEEFTQLKSSQMLYELDQSASTITALNIRQKTQARIILVACIASVIFIAFLLVVMWQNRKLRHAYTDLFERNSRQLAEERAYKAKIKQLQQQLDEKISDGNSQPDSSPAPARKPILDNDRRIAMAKEIEAVMEGTDAYCSPDFNIDSLAAMIGSNPRYVSEVVNDVMGKNFRALLNEYRIKMAMTRLEDTDNYGHLTMKAISESVGYRSQATFISVFTKQTGLKPSLYQRLAQEKK